MIFPGRIFDAEGASVEPGFAPLVQEMVDGCPHRSMVGCEALGYTPENMGQVWLLDDDATYATVPLAIRAAALERIAIGQGILILARRQEAEVDVRDGLLNAMEALNADPAGRA